jgi:DNA polymerase elongation subunit (family B)
MLTSEMTNLEKVKIEVDVNNIEKIFAKAENNKKEDDDQEDDENEDDIDDENEQYDDINDDEESEDREETKIEKINIRNTLLGYIQQRDKIKRDDLVQQVNAMFKKYIPELEGDIVTFIGSTFVRYGEKLPYLNHCIVLGSCDVPEDVENCVIECYQTEREVLLAWTALIQRMNPDMMIGYNTNMFDYRFLFERAEENNCVREFLLLSRNKTQVCGNLRGGKYEIEHKVMEVASGVHETYYIKMAGRMQDDLLNYYRKNSKFDSYSLDFVSGSLISDEIVNIQIVDENATFQTKNITGLSIGSYIHIKVMRHSSKYLDNGKKWKVIDIQRDETNKIYTVKIDGYLYNRHNKKTVLNWCLAKDDVSPKKMAELTKGTSTDRSIVAKYCIQDCNLVHHLFSKSDIMTGYVEMSNICCVPISVLIERGQGIKLASLVSKFCRERGVLMPVIAKGSYEDAYDGAIVLEPVCDFYMEDPVACNDFNSLYPSSMISNGLSPDAKVMTKDYDLVGNMVAEWGEKNADGTYKYDNLPEYDYMDVPYMLQKNIMQPNGKVKKIHVGTRICRIAISKDQKDMAILPAVLSKLLDSRKKTRAGQKKVAGTHMWGVLEQRQLGYKLSANSIYGQNGAKTSCFYEKDVAACTTAVGRQLLTFAKRIVEECYDNTVVETSYGKVITHAKYIYGDTDSVFYTLYMTEIDGKTEIKGTRALEITIEIAQEIGKLASSFLKPPHNWEYEKTFLPFCILSKKRYVGMLYTTMDKKCKRKAMGLEIVRRDNAPCLKDVYGEIIDILMEKQNLQMAVNYLTDFLRKFLAETIPMEDLIISKSLKGYYKKPEQIAHKVLADRMAEREPGNKPCAGDRIPYIFVWNPKAKKNGEKIETPKYILENRLKIDYGHYVSNLLAKPISKFFAIVLEKLFSIVANRMLETNYAKEYEKLKKMDLEKEKYDKKKEAIRMKYIQLLLFQDIITQIHQKQTNQSNITTFFKKATTTTRKPLTFVEDA